MTFQPVLPLSGFAGWNFLQETYDKQLETYSASPQIQRDVDYFTEKLTTPISVEDFVSDPRLRRISLTAFGLSGEEWKTGYIRNVLEQVQDPDSTFLQRLNNPQYTSYAEAFEPANGQINLLSAEIDSIAARFTAESFEIAVGQQDDTMRLSLNFQDGIGELVTEGSTDEAVLFKLLGSTPIRTVLETALGIPANISQLDVDRQAEFLNDRLKSQFGINSVQDLKSPEVIEKVLQRYQILAGINQNFGATSSASTALVLLGNAAAGFGSLASQNLFLSGL
ncbi:MAG: DUF1217 domain-containing protein [Pseudomonadota bacterium]